MSYNLKNKEGFTIIEVLIVLMIAGLVMVVVFLAVPGLQRNQRNSQQRTEANNLLAAASEISANKGGAAVVSGDSANILSAANTKNITGLTIEAETGTTVPADTTSATLRTNAKCNSSFSETDPGTNSKQYALLFRVETAGGTQVQCVGS